MRAMHEKVTGELTQLLTLIFGCSNSLLYWVSVLSDLINFCQKIDKFAPHEVSGNTILVHVELIAFACLEQGKFKVPSTITKVLIILDFSKNGSKFSKVWGSASARWERGSSPINRKPHHKVRKLKSKWTTLAWAICFPIADYVKFSKEIFIFYLKIIHWYACEYLKNWKINHVVCNGKTNRSS